jgi:predicted ATPase
MKHANINDQWRTASKRKFKNHIGKISFENLQLFGTNELVFKDGGINAICGLNGSGKSTLISAIKSILQIKVEREKDLILFKKIRGAKIHADLFLENTAKVSKIEYNSDLTILSDDITEGVPYLFIDLYSANEVLKLYHEKDIFEVVKDQLEPYNLKPHQLLEISQICGKEYSGVSIYEMEEVGQYSRFPYFKVISKNVEYGSDMMGFGEHALFYLYWNLISAGKDSIIIVEEPETFVSAYSQECLLNFIAKYSAENGIWFLISTHSPTILKNIPNKNIFLLNTTSDNEILITTPTDNTDYENFLRIKLEKIGVVFTEDEVSLYFAQTWMSHYSRTLEKQFTFQKLNGESQLKEALSFVKIDNSPFKIIGVFDGDMNGKLNGGIIEKFNWPHLVLPGLYAPEIELKNATIKSIPKLALRAHRSEIELKIIIDRLSTLDHHDWLIELEREIGFGMKGLVKILFSLWIEIPENVPLSDLSFEEFKKIFT